MRYTLADVTAALRAAADKHPDRVDARAARNLGPRYIEHGQPCCLVAQVLADLGIPVGVLRQLDRESGAGGGGTVFRESRHPMLRRIDPLARELLDYVQHRNDMSYPWARVVRYALDEPADSWGTPRPWQTPPDQTATEEATVGDHTTATQHVLSALNTDTGVYERITEPEPIRAADDYLRTHGAAAGDLSASDGYNKGETYRLDLLDADDQVVDTAEIVAR